MRFIWEQGYDICLYNPKTRNEWIRFIGHIECCLVTYPLILSVISMMR